MTDIVERLQYYTPYGPITDMQADAIMKEAAAEIELMRHALACVVLYWDEWMDAPEDHPTALSLEEVVDMCRAHLGEKE